MKKAAMGIAFTFAYLVAQVFGMPDVPNVWQEIAIPSFLAIAFSLAFLRFAGGPIWLPTAIVGLAFMIEHLPVYTVSASVQVSPTSEGERWWFAWQFRDALLFAPLVFAGMASWLYNSRKSA